MAHSESCGGGKGDTTEKESGKLARSLTNFPEPLAWLYRTTKGSAENKKEQSLGNFCSN